MGTPRGGFVGSPRVSPTGTPIGPSGERVFTPDGNSGRGKKDIMIDPE